MRAPVKAVYLTGMVSLDPRKVVQQASFLLLGAVGLDPHHKIEDGQVYRGHLAPSYEDLYLSTLPPEDQHRRRHIRQPSRVVWTLIGPASKEQQEAYDAWKVIVRTLLLPGQLETLNRAVDVAGAFVARRDSWRREHPRRERFHEEG